MRHTLIFGTPVARDGNSFGVLSRIVVNNGVANQIVVNPSGLFSGPERVIPINDVDAADADVVSLSTSGDEWKSYNAYEMDVYRLEEGSADTTQVIPGTVEVMRAVARVSTAESMSTETTVDDLSVVLTRATTVSGKPLDGLIIDTGIPQALLVGDQTVDFTQVSTLNASHIELGGAGEAPPSADPTRAR